LNNILQEYETTIGCFSEENGLILEMKGPAIDGPTASFDPLGFPLIARRVDDQDWETIAHPPRSVCSQSMVNRKNTNITNITNIHNSYGGFPKWRYQKIAGWFISWKIPSKNG